MDGFVKMIMVSIVKRLGHQLILRVKIEKLFSMLVLFSIGFVFVSSCEDEKPAESPDPVLFITYPISGSTVSDTIIIVADVVNNDNVREVQFYIDGQLLFIDHNAPWEYIWDTRFFSNNQHSIYCKVYDNDDNEGISDKINVQVRNMDKTHFSYFSPEGDTLHIWDISTIDISFTIEPYYSSKSYQSAFAFFNKYGKSMDTISYTLSSKNFHLGVPFLTNNHWRQSKLKAILYKNNTIVDSKELHLLPIHQYRGGSFEIDEDGVIFLHGMVAYGFEYKYFIYSFTPAGNIIDGITLPIRDCGRLFLRNDNEIYLCVNNTEKKILKISKSLSSTSLESSDIEYINQSGSWAGGSWVSNSQTGSIYHYYTDYSNSPNTGVYIERIVGLNDREHIYIGSDWTETPFRLQTTGAGVIVYDNDSKILKTLDDSGIVDTLVQVQFAMNWEWDCVYHGGILYLLTHEGISTNPTLKKISSDGNIITTLNLNSLTKFIVNEQDLLSNDMLLTYSRHEESLKMYDSDLNLLWITYESDIASQIGLQFGRFPKSHQALFLNTSLNNIWYSTYDQSICYLMADFRTNSYLGNKSLYLVKISAQDGSLVSYIDISELSRIRYPE